MGFCVGELVAGISSFVAGATANELLLLATLAGLAAVLVTLAADHWRLRKRHAAVEAELFENTVGKESTNWTNAALNLERQAKDPGIVARSSVTMFENGDMDCDCLNISAF